MNIEYSEKMRQELKAKAILELPNGCDPVRVDDPTSDLHGEYVCITCRHNEQRAKHRAKTTDYGGGPMSLQSIIEGDEAKRAEKEKKEQEDQEERERKEQAAAEKAAAAAAQRDELLTRVGKLEVAMSSALEMPSETSADIAAQIAKVEEAAKGMNTKQHDKIREARELIKQLTHKKKERRVVEDAEKKRKAEHVKRIMEEGRQEDREEKLEQLRQKRQRRGDELDHWTQKAKPYLKKGVDVDFRKVLEQMRKDWEAEWRLENSM